MANVRKDLSGQVFDKLTVIEPVGSVGKGETLYRCLCECGKECTRKRAHLKKSGRHGCGCIYRPHGKYGTAIYRIWCGMIARITNPKAISFKHYGGRGLGVDTQWYNSFVEFYKDVGDRPSPNHSLDRIDNEIGYYKFNVKWSTSHEQAVNRRSNVKLELNGEILAISEWARKMGFSHRSLISQRLKKGWSVEDALTKKVGERFGGRFKNKKQ